MHKDRLNRHKLNRRTFGLERRATELATTATPTDDQHLIEAAIQAGKVTLIPASRKKITAHKKPRQT